MKYELKYQNLQRTTGIWRCRLQTGCNFLCFGPSVLTHWVLNKWANFFADVILNAISLMEFVLSRLEYQWNLFPRVEFVMHFAVDIFHTLPECRCVCVENPVTFSMMVTHELHSTTNWRRHSDIRHPQRLCTDFPTFDISSTTLQQHKANLPATDNPTSDISRTYHMLQSRHSDDNNNCNALRQYGKTTFLYINNFTITRRIQPPRHYDNFITLLALMSRHFGNPPLYHCM